MAGKEKPVFPRLVRPEPEPRTRRGAWTRGSDDIYVIRITLVGSKPPIWRRVAVPSDFTFAQMHDVIQAVMGWYNCHLHMFETGEGEHYTAVDPEFAADWDEDIGDATEVELRDVLRRPKDRCVYTYDFGDDWQHKLELQKIVAREPDKDYPVCLAGRRACPPEDCGGIWGYADMLSALADSESPEHQEYVEWLGHEFDAEAFDLEAVNGRLRGCR